VITPKVAIPGIMYAAGLLAQGDPTVPGWFGSIIQFGSFGVLCYVLWWIISKHIPNLTSTFKDSLDAVTKESSTRTDKFVEVLDRKDQDMINLVQDLRKTDK
jgi:hypothetical protein